MEQFDRVNIFPQFLSFLTTYPPPQCVAEALTQGPLTLLNTSAVTLYAIDSAAKLTLVGTQGSTDESTARYSQLSLTIDTPISRSLATMSTEAITISDMLQEYPAMALDTRIWENKMAKMGDHTLVCSPLISRGIAIGAFVLYVPIDHVWLPQDQSFIDGIAALISMWLAHYNSIQAEQNNALTHETDVALHLDERQLQILQLVEQGRSNTSIAFALGYSESTVKQDLQRAMKILRTKDRQDAALRARSLGMQH
jgi:DNA-binding CsgD family transcriptional regulator